MDVLNDPHLSWKYVENMYYMNVQLNSSLLISILSDSNILEQNTKEGYNIYLGGTYLRERTGYTVCTKFI